MMKTFIAALLLLGLYVPVAHADSLESCMKNHEPLGKCMKDFMLDTAGDYNNPVVQKNFCAKAPALWQKAIKEGISTDGTLQGFRYMINDLHCTFPKGGDA